MEKLAQISALKHFEATGEILPALYVYFDQEGNWVKGELREKDVQGEVKLQTLGKLQELKIEKEKLRQALPSGEVRLLSSFCSFSMPEVKKNSKKEKPRILEYSEICGSLYACFENTSFPNLTVVQRNLSPFGPSKNIYLPKLEMVGKDLVSVSGLHFELPELEEVGGFCQFDQGNSFVLPKLKNVGKGFYAPSTAELELPSLLRVGGNVSLRILQVAHFEHLQEVTGIFDIERAKTCKMPKLQSVGTFNTRCQNPQLESLTHVTQNLSLESTGDIELPALEEIFGDLLILEVRSASFPKLKAIGGRVLAHKAQSLHTPCLRKIGRSFRDLASSIYGCSLGATKSILRGLQTQELKKIRKLEETTYLHDQIDEELSKREFIGKLGSDGLELS